MKQKHRLVPVADVSAADYAGMSQRENKAREVLQNRLAIPVPQDVMGIEDSALFNAAEELGYPIYDLNKYLEAQQLFLPYLENMLTWLLRNTREPHTVYYPIARDALLIYDALWALDQTPGKVNQRIIATNWRMRQQGDLNRDYLRERGISPQAVNTEAIRPIFLDSGFKGTCINNCLFWGGFKSREGIRGYLVCRRDGPYDQMRLNDISIDPNLGQSITRAIGEIDPRWNRNYEVPFCYELAGFMQIMPKPTESFHLFYRQGDCVEVRPEITEYPRIGAPTINDALTDVHASVVDPVASVRLRRDVLTYFLKPDVRDRVSERSGNRNMF